MRTVVAGLVVLLAACGGDGGGGPSAPPAQSEAVFRDGEWLVTIRDGRGTAVGTCTFPEENTYGVTDAAGAITVCRSLLGV